MTNLTFDAEIVRLHFNRHGAAPLVWCVSTDDIEIAVRGFTTSLTIDTVYQPKATPDDEDGKPSAWLEPIALGVRVRIVEGWAFIEETE